MGRRRCDSPRLSCKTPHPNPKDARCVAARRSLAPRSSDERTLSGLLQLSPPPVRESEAAPCPLLAGWVNPTIVLPAGFTQSAKPAELQMAVAHELAHLKRKDLWLAATPFLTQAIFYFHPLAWLAIRESAAASEEACDIEAMRLSGGSPSAYARLLLNSAKAYAPFVAMGAAIGFPLTSEENPYAQSIQLPRSASSSQRLHGPRRPGNGLLNSVDCNCPNPRTKNPIRRPRRRPRPPPPITLRPLPANASAR